MRIVVVGGGVVALASAYRLAKAGCEVVVLEARTAGSAATHGNAAKIALAESGPVPAPGVILQGLRWMLKPDSPLYVKPSVAPDFIKFMLTMARHCNARDFRFGLETHLRLASDANDLLDEYTKDGIEFEMHKAGVLLAFETRERYEEHCGSLQIFEGFGMHPTHLDSDGVQETEPALNHRIKHGLFFADDRQLEPDSLTRALVKRCEELGVQIRENTKVGRFLRRGSTVTGVVTDTGEQIDGDALLLAAGVWSGPLSKELGAPMPIRPGKGYSVDYSPAPIKLNTSLTLEDARVAVTPLDGMIRLAGTMEFGGFEESVNQTRSPPSSVRPPRTSTAGTTRPERRAVGGTASDDPGRPADRRQVREPRQRLHRLRARHAGPDSGAGYRRDHHRNHCQSSCSGDRHLDFAQPLPIPARLRRA